MLPIYATPTIHHVWAISVSTRSAKFRTDMKAPSAAIQKYIQFYLIIPGW